MHKIMTADEITQLLLDHNVIILFNENIPCNEHDQTTQLIKKALEAEKTKYTWTEYSLKQNSKNTAYTNAKTFLNRMLDLLRDIKDGGGVIDNQTILCDDGLLGIFTHLFTPNRIPELLSTLQYCHSGSRKAALESLNRAITRSYSDGIDNAPSSDATIIYDGIESNGKLYQRYFPMREHPGDYL
ncbi:MAG: hypothetical protein J5965_21965 [Aeriscardovia sp.]|nr:hypothetical protein [Aeriscardovia sp.]